MSRLRDSDNSIASVLETETSGVTVPRFILNFDQFKERIESFQARFDQTVQLTNDSVNQINEEFSNTLEDNRETEKLMKSEINSKKDKEEQLSKRLRDVKEELDRTRSSLQERQEKRLQLLATQSKYQQQIDSLQTQIEKKRKLRLGFRENVLEQTTYNDTELLYWEDVLGLRIQGVKENYLKFIFTNLDSANITSECYFVLDMTHEDFAVPETSPEIAPNKLSKVLDQLNQTKQIGLFFKDMRNLFKEACNLT